MAGANNRSGGSGRGAGGNIGPSAFAAASARAQSRAQKSLRNAVQMHNGTATAIWARQVEPRNRAKVFRRDVTTASAINYQQGRAVVAMQPRGRNPQRINRSGFRAPATRLY